MSAGPGQPTDPAVRRDLPGPYPELGDGDRSPLRVDDTGALVVTGIAGGAGGTNVEYTEGQVDATLTGQIMLWEDTADTVRAVSAAKPLPVAIISGGAGGSAGTIDAPADNKTPTLAQHVQAFLSVFDGTDWDRARGDTANGLDVDVTRVQGSVAVTGPLTDAQLRAAVVPVSDGGGSLTVDGPVTDAQLRASAVPVSGPLTDAQLRAAVVPTQDSRLPAALDADGGLKVHQQSVVPVSDNGGSLTVDGTVGVSGAVDTELPAAAALADNAANPTVPGVGAFAMVWDGVTWDRSTQPLTDAQLRASAVPVSGPLTDAQLRASAVPVSGTVTVQDGGGAVSVDDNGGSLTVDGPLTDAQLRAAAVPVIPAADTVVTGNLTAAQPTAGTPVAGGTVEITLPDGSAQVSFEITGTVQQAATTLLFEVMPKGSSNWIGRTVANPGNPTSIPMSSTNGSGFGAVLGAGVVPSAGLEKFRIRMSVLGAADAPTIRLISSPAPQPYVPQFTVVHGPVVEGGSTSGAVGNPVRVAGKDAAGLQRTLLTDTSGRLRAPKVATYTAFYRLAARPYALSNTFGAAGRKQFATLYHTNTSTKTIRIRHVQVFLVSMGAAAIVEIEFVRLTSATTPATGNPAITPQKHEPADTMDTQTVALALPTTAGAEDTGSILALAHYQQTAASIGQGAAVPAPYQPVDLIGEANEVDDDAKSLSVASGVAGGFAVIADSNAATAVTLMAKIKFTEE